VKIGVLTSEFTKSGPMPAEALFAKIKRFGFGAAQLSFSSVSEMEYASNGQYEIPGEISDCAICVIAGASKRHDVPITVCSGTFNMAHPDALVRGEGIKRFELLAKSAKQLGCGMVSLCSGTRCESHLWTFHKDNDTKEAWEAMIGTMKKAAKIAESHGIVAAVETEMANIVNSPEKARKMMDETNSPNIKMIMDCANLFPAGKAKKENVHGIMRHAFELFGGEAVIAHGKDIAESEGIKFCPTGEGIVDFGLFFELLGQYGYKGDMLLHGIYDEGKIARAYGLIENILASENKGVK